MFISFSLFFGTWGNVNTSGKKSQVYTPETCKLIYRVKTCWTVFHSKLGIFASIFSTCGMHLVFGVQCWTGFHTRNKIFASANSVHGEHICFLNTMLNRFPYWKQRLLLKPIHYMMNTSGFWVQWWTLFGRYLNKQQMSLQIKLDYHTHFWLQGRDKHHGRSLK